MKRELELKVEELLEKLKVLKVPEAPEDWYPFGISSDNFVLASRERENRLEIKPFRREGIWKEIGRYLEERERLSNEIEKTLRKDPEYDVIIF